MAKTLVAAMIMAPIVVVGTTVTEVNRDHTAWQDQPAGECLIVLGSRSLPGGIPGLMMRERLATAEQVITEETKYVILTGGSLDEEKTEAEVMKDQLVAAGIDEEKFLLETDSTSTYENLAFSKPLLEEAECQTIDILTHEFHLSRVALTAGRQGIMVNRLIPAQNARADTLPRLAREHLAYMWYWLVGGSLNPL